MNQKLDITYLIKDKKNVLFILICIFVVPFFIFPDHAKTIWEMKLYQYITHNLGIIVGTNGPLPYFSVLTRVYLTLVLAFIFLFYIFPKLRKIGLGLNFQKEFYECILSEESLNTSTELSWKERFKQSPFFSAIAMLLVSIGIIFLFFSEENISFPEEQDSHHSHHRGLLNLIYSAYNYKIGIFLLEIVNSIFVILAVFYVFCLCCYLWNLCFRNLGIGK
ncbi:hypothetical protein [Acinetobacter sp. MD2(2019)]|uniref:hypothetical protein n=1 Tax=Acinetobacter sp. MD2(2019) TaxID=2605273 RepID=UPI002D1E7200|nr:hypothetical protein [Acinetobacter sp. MD2(2019)]MEB3754824.1 hypothetical protein [Acinetobacter sp. MD2(2019)]